MAHETEPTMEDYVRVAAIYGREDKEDLLSEVREYSRNCRFHRSITLDKALGSYLEIKLGVPVDYWSEICKLQRKLSSLELEALWFKAKVKEQGNLEILVTIKGLE